MADLTIGCAPAILTGVAGDAARSSSIQIIMSGDEEKSESEFVLAPGELLSGISGIVSGFLGAGAGVAPATASSIGLDALARPQSGISRSPAMGLSDGHKQQIAAACRHYRAKASVLQITKYWLRNGGIGHDDDDPALLERTARKWEGAVREYLLSLGYHEKT